MKFLLLSVLLTLVLIGTDATRSKSVTAKTQTKKAPLIDPKERVLSSFSNQCIPRPLLFSITSSFGGQTGTKFDDTSSLRFDEELKAIHLRAGFRIDKISFQTQYNTYSHGGEGGFPKSFHLASSEKFTSVVICYIDADPRSTIFYLKFTTNRGRVFEGGRRADICYTIHIPNGKEIVAGFGRADFELRKLGFVLRSSPIVLCAF